MNSDQKVARQVALILPYNAEGRILLQLRTDDATHLPGFWSHFGGGIQEDESPQLAARREFIEELETDLGEVELFRSYTIEQHAELRRKFVFLIPISESADDLRVQLREGQDLNYFSFEEIKKLKYPTWDLIIVKDAFDEIAARREKSRQ